jgi:hypothetical protein
VAMVGAAGGPPGLLRLQKPCARKHEYHERPLPSSTIWQIHPAAVQEMYGRVIPLTLPSLRETSGVSYGDVTVDLSRQRPCARRSIGMRRQPKDQRHPSEVPAALPEA